MSAVYAVLAQQGKQVAAGKCRAVQFSRVQYSSVNYSTVQFSIVQYSLALNSKVQLGKHRRAGVTCSKLRIVMLAEGLTQGRTIEMLHPTFCIHRYCLISSQNYSLREQQSNISFKEQAVMTRYGTIAVICVTISGAEHQFARYKTHLIIWC